MRFSFKKHKRSILNVFEGFKLSCNNIACATTWLRNEKRTKKIYRVDMLIVPLYVWRVQRKTRQRHQIASISRQHWISNFTIKCSQLADERSSRRNRPASRMWYEPSASEEYCSKVTHTATNIRSPARTKVSVRSNVRLHITTTKSIGTPANSSVVVCLFAGVNWAVRLLYLLVGLACVWNLCTAWNQLSESGVRYIFDTSKCNEQFA